MIIPEDEYSVMSSQSLFRSEFKSTKLFENEIHTPMCSGIPKSEYGKTT